MSSGPARYQANVVVRFLLELCPLAALFYRGARMGNRLVGVVPEAVAAVIAAVVWGLFAPPRARVSLRTAGRPWV